MTTGKLILIVEDNEKNLKLVRDLLQFHGYQTLDARTAEAGVAAARQRLPNLILMDIELPQMDGVTALHQLRAEPATRAIPVVAVTASAMQADRQRLLGEGFDGYIIKPISVAEFPKQILPFLQEAPRP